MSVFTLVTVLLIVGCAGLIIASMVRDFRQRRTWEKLGNPLLIGHLDGLVKKLWKRDLRREDAVVVDETVEQGRGAERRLYLIFRSGHSYIFRIDKRLDRAWVYLRVDGDEINVPNGQMIAAPWLMERVRRIEKMVDQLPSRRAA